MIRVRIFESWGLSSQMACSHTVADADDGVRHFVLESVDEVEEVAAVVPPACYESISLRED